MSVRELVVASGKGGTGKTSLVGSFAVLASRAVLADCDVDAADLHLLLSPAVRRREEFRGGRVAVIDAGRCTGCGECERLCRFGAVVRADASDGGSHGDGGDGRGDRDGADGRGRAGDSPSLAFLRIDPVACEGCGVCVDHCPERAIDFPERASGEWFVSETRCGPMVHARLGIAAENSGKLVSVVRAEARRIAAEEGRGTVLVDGPPGIGCPVIASVTGASAVLAVTEPSVSGEHDLERLLELCRHFEVPVAVCVNRWDVNPEAGSRIETRALERGAVLAGRIPFDRTVTAAQLAARTVVELGGPAANAVRGVWQRWNEAILHA
jgi:MinD superfamily P-loop ATPase